MSMPTSFSYNPFQKLTRTTRINPMGDNQQSYDHAEEYTGLSDELQRSNPALAENWSNSSNMQVLDGDAENGYRVKVKTSDKQGTIYHLTPDGKGGYSVSEAAKVAWDTNQNLFDDKMALAMMAAVGGIGAAAYGAGGAAAGSLPVEGGLAAGNAVGGLGTSGATVGSGALNAAEMIGAAPGGGYGAAGEAATGALNAAEMIGAPQATEFTLGGADLLPGNFAEGGLMNAGAATTETAAATGTDWVANLAAAEKATGAAMGTVAGAGEAVGSFTGSLSATAKAGLTGIGWLDSIIEVGKTVWDVAGALKPGQAGLIGGAAKLVTGLYLDDKAREAYEDYLNRVDEWRKEDKETAEKSREDEQAFRKSEREAAEAYQKRLIEEQRAYQEKKEKDELARKNVNWNVSGISVGKPWKMKPRAGIVGSSLAIGG